MTCFGLLLLCPVALPWGSGWWGGVGVELSGVNAVLIGAWMFEPLPDERGCKGDNPVASSVWSSRQGRQCSRLGPNSTPHTNAGLSEAPWHTCRKGHPTPSRRVIGNA